MCGLLVHIESSELKEVSAIQPLSTCRHLNDDVSRYAYLCEVILMMMYLDMHTYVKSS